VAAKNNATLATLLSRKRQSSKGKMTIKNGMATEAFASTKHMPEIATDAEH
jgi:hypothetical protein